MREDRAGKGVQLRGFWFVTIAACEAFRDDPLNDWKLGTRTAIIIFPTLTEIPARLIMVIFWQDPGDGLIL